MEVKPKPEPRPTDTEIAVQNFKSAVLELRRTVGWYGVAVHLLRELRHYYTPESIKDLKKLPW